MSTVTVGPLNWMAGIDDATSIRDMSILGSHESCSLYGGGPTQCQSLSITEQLERGVRFLDIRCVHAHGTWNFPIMHNIVDQYINFEQVQDECRTFLRAHPTETILMNLQHEENGGLANRTGEEFLERFLDLMDPAYWRFHSSIPNLEACRQQIILVRPYNPATNEGWPATYPAVGKQLPGGTGLEWNGFSIDGTSYNQLFETQNGWGKYDTAANGSSNSWADANHDKAEAVKSYLRLAADGQTGADRIYLNFLSRAAGAYVGSAAEIINKDIVNYLQTTLTDMSKRLGIVPIDFVGNTGTNGLESLILHHNPFKAGDALAY
jgi:Phosphatidylinositol-specific phospholipase C, X domain